MGRVGELCSFGAEGARGTVKKRQGEAVPWRAPRSKADSSDFLSRRKPAKTTASAER